MRGQKFIKNAKNGQFWRVLLENYWCKKPKYKNSNATF